MKANEIINVCVAAGLILISCTLIGGMVFVNQKMASLETAVAGTVAATENAKQAVQGLGENVDKLKAEASEFRTNVKDLGATFEKRNAEFQKSLKESGLIDKWLKKPE